MGEDESSCKTNNINLLFNNLEMNLKCKTIFSLFLRNTYSINNKRFLSTPSEIQRQCDLFTAEQKRQREAVGRIEKIDVLVKGYHEDVSLVMNKNLSTPYDCARHVDGKAIDRSAVALVNDEILWHMHKPLPDSCKMEFLNYHSAQPAGVNKAYWRTCSFILGALVSQAFKDKVDVQLHSFPIPNIKSGSFVYDVQLSLDNWKPTEKELRVLSLETRKFTFEEHPIQCLDVTPEFALQVFAKNQHKTKQIPDIALNNNGKVTLFKAGHHVDISKGPMIANTKQIGRFSVTNVVKLDTDIKGNPIYRFQGVSLPSTIVLNHYAYGILEKRAKELNPARIPGSQGVATEENSFMAQVN